MKTWIEFAWLNGGGALWVGPKRTAAVNKIFSLQLLTWDSLPSFPDAIPTAAAQKKMASPSHIRSLYRSILREIPHRPLSTPSQIQQRIRSSFTSPLAPDGSNHHNTVTQQVAEGEEYLRYAKAQRMYTVLLERYNPGIGSMMDEDERTRLTARRVGINLPEEYDSTSR